MCNSPFSNYASSDHVDYGLKDDTQHQAPNLMSYSIVRNLDGASLYKLKLMNISYLLEAMVEPISPTNKDVKFVLTRVSSNITYTSRRHIKMLSSWSRILCGVLFLHCRQHCDRETDADHLYMMEFVDHWDDHE